MKKKTRSVVVFFFLGVLSGTASMLPPYLRARADAADTMRAYDRLLIWTFPEWPRQMRRYHGGHSVRIH